MSPNQCRMDTQLSVHAKLYLLSMSCTKSVMSKRYSLPPMSSANLSWRQKSSGQNPVSMPPVARSTALHVRRPLSRLLSWPHP
ncbi:unnamed protein product [Chondrus crispus]|uniref:Uncharacterized protein n=1 Tax=Chondrus crispus TaxID=2769 RepID=R7QJV6_CHOCR|nr:unnamed protein product [Chondrus crispus]CDF37761.1 unnamed protein product [Chondrus crispus]|eukprot:XP_005717632.1 unnamed protein product [Chondrus crispus]